MNNASKKNILPPHPSKTDLGNKTFEASSVFALISFCWRILKGLGGVCNRPAKDSSWFLSTLSIPKGARNTTAFAGLVYRKPPASEVGHKCKNVCLLLRLVCTQLSNRTRWIESRRSTEDTPGSLRECRMSERNAGSSGCNPIDRCFPNSWLRATNGLWVEFSVGCKKVWFF